MKRYECFLVEPGLCRRTTLGALLMLLQSQSAHRQTSRPWPHRRRRAPPGAGPDERARGKQERSEEGGAKNRGEEGVTTAPRRAPHTNRRVVVEERRRLSLPALWPPHTPTSRGASPSLARLTRMENSRGHLAATSGVGFLTRGIVAVDDLWSSFRELAVDCWGWTARSGAARLVRMVQEQGLEQDRCASCPVQACERRRSRAPRCHPHKV